MKPMLKVLLITLCFIAFGPGWVRAQDSTEAVKEARLQEINKIYDSLYPRYVGSNSGWIQLTTMCNQLIATDTGYYKGVALYIRARADYFLGNKTKSKQDALASVDAYPYYYPAYEEVSIDEEYHYGSDGFCKQRSKIWRRGEKNYLKIEAYNEDKPDYWYELAKIRWQIGFICKDPIYKRLSINTYLKVLALDSDYSRAWVDIGQNHPDADSAIYYLKKGLKTKGSYPFMRECLLARLRDKKAYRQELLVVNEGIADDPGYYEFYLWRSDIYKALGNKKQAAADQKTYHKLMK